MTKVYIDITQFMQIDAITGIQRVMRELMVRLLKRTDLETELIVWRHERQRYVKVDNAKMRRYLETGKGRKDDTYGTVQLELDDLEPGAVFFEIDVAWSAVLKRSWLLPRLKKQGLILVAMIYDIMAVTHYQYFHPFFTYEFMEFIGAHVQHDDLIIVNTHPSEQILLDFAEKIGRHGLKTEVVHFGGDFQGQNKHGTGEARQKVIQIANRRKYILLVGTLEPRKNHKLVYDAYRKELCKKDINIIFAGRTGWIDENFLHRLYADKDFDKRIFHIKDANNADLQYLYDHAFVVAFPTHMEGYGLPIVEALQKGAVVVTTDIDVLREVGGDYCVYFKPNSPADFAAKVTELMDDRKKYSMLRERAAGYHTFTWDEAAEQFAEVLKAADRG